jgi:lysyl-tRNA synthetase class 2
MLSLEGLHLRAAVFRSIRNFFTSRNFLEVDTPVRLPVLIPESNIQPIKAGSWFLQTSPEQCMKRLLARGCEKIFQICPCFRAGEHGKKHLEEFTMLEWYRTEGDYNDLMADCQNLIRYIIDELSGFSRFKSYIDNSCFGSMKIGEDWQKLSVKEAFAAYSSLSLDAALSEKRFDELMVEHIEPNLGKNQPLFLYDYPAQCASLARLKHDDQSVAERFELYIQSMELANGFSELTDPQEQRARFGEELKGSKNNYSATGQMPERFLQDLAKLKQAAGIAFGLDRLLMLIMSASSIQSVVPFSPKAW